MLTAQPRHTLSQAYELIDEGNPYRIEAYLNAWSAASPREIDLFVARFNYDYDRSVSLRSDSLYASALGHLNVAVGIQPMRLDLWLKTIYALNQRGYYADQADLMIALMDASDRQSHEWLWEGDMPLQESKTVFLLTMHDHLQQWIGLSEPPARHLRRVAARLSELFPRDASAVAAIGLSHILEGATKEGVRFLTRATELEPSNGSVWYMLAGAYESEGDVAGAVAAYRQLENVGNEEMKAVARERLKALGN